MKLTLNRTTQEILKIEEQKKIKLKKNNQFRYKSGLDKYFIHTPHTQFSEIYIREVHGPICDIDATSQYPSICIQEKFPNPEKLEIIGKQNKKPNGEGMLEVSLFPKDKRLASKYHYLKYPQYGKSFELSLKNINELHTYIHTCEWEVLSKIFYIEIHSGIISEPIDHPKKNKIKELLIQKDLETDPEKIKKLKMKTNIYTSESFYKTYINYEKINSIFGLKELPKNWSLIRPIGLYIYKAKVPKASSFYSIGSHIHAIAKARLLSLVLKLEEHNIPIIATRLDGLHINCEKNKIKEILKDQYGHTPGKWRTKIEGIHGHWGGPHNFVITNKDLEITGSANLPNPNNPKIIKTEYTNLQASFTRTKKINKSKPTFRRLNFKEIKNFEISNKENNKYLLKKHINFCNKYWNHKK